MNAIPALETQRVTRAFVALSLAHAVLVTGGPYFVWAVRSFTTIENQIFARSAEPIWHWLLVLWPLWWLVCLVLNRDNRRGTVTPLMIATVIWLMTAIPAFGVYWYGWWISH